MVDAGTPSSLNLVEASSIVSLPSLNSDFILSVSDIIEGV